MRRSIGVRWMPSAGEGVRLGPRLGAHTRAAGLAHRAPDILVDQLATDQEVAPIATRS
jgi:hypothetical protein